MISAYDLGSTKTYARRDALWLPAGPGWYPDPRDGTLTITLAHSRRTGASLEVDSYAVEREPASPDTPDVSGFLLCNLTDPNQAEVYRVVIAPKPEGDRCSCICGNVKRYICKHISALRAILENQ